jgi:hypothetical protein
MKHRPLDQSRQQDHRQLLFVDVLLSRFYHRIFFYCPCLKAFSATAATAKTSLAVELDPLLPYPLGVIDAATLGSSCDIVAALGACCPDSGAPLIVDPTL